METNEVRARLSLWMILTTLTAWDFGTAAIGLSNFLPFFLLAATTSYIVRTPAQFIHLLWLFVVGSILVGGFGILQVVINRPDLRSKKIKNNVKSAVKFISNFENVCTELAIENNFDYVICGHIHEPKIETIKNDKGETLYLNSGDWIENLSALEYNEDQWKLYFYEQDAVAQQVDLASLQSKTMDIPELFNLLISQTQKV